MKILNRLFFDIRREDRSEKQQRYYRAIYQLLGVSKRWEVLIKGTAELWGLVDSRYPPEVWKAALERSGSSPLHVVYYKREALKVGAESMLEVAAPHVGRWRSAILRVPEQQDVAAIEQAGASQLKELHLISTHASDQSPLVFDLIQMRTPGLFKLRLSRVALESWASPLLFNLHHLDICGSVPNYALSLSQLLDIIQGSPELESLCLRKIRTRDQALQPRSSISLPRLRRLNFIDLKNVTKLILDALAIPSCTTYSLTEPPVLVAPSFKYVTSAFQTCLRTADSLDVTIGLGYRSVTTHTGGSSSPKDPSFSLYIFNRHYEAARVLLDCAVPLIEAEPNVAITLTIQYMEDLADGLAALMRRLPGIVNINLSALMNQHVQRLMEILCIGSKHNGLSEWLCPNLALITLHDCDDESELLEMLKARIRAFEQPDPSAEKRGVGRVSRLEKFQVARFNEDTNRKVRALLNGEDITSTGDETEGYNEGVE